MFESDAKGRAEEEKLRTKWIPQFKDTRSSTVLLGETLGLSGDVSIEDMFSDRHYLSKATEVHAVAMQRAGAKCLSGNILNPWNRLCFKSGGLIRGRSPMWTNENRKRYDRSQ